MVGWWGSMQKMIARLLEQEKAIRIVLGSVQTASNLFPTWQDLDVRSTISNILSPLEDFTDVKSGERYSMSLALLFYHNKSA